MFHELFSQTLFSPIILTPFSSFSVTYECFYPPNASSSLSSSSTNIPRSLLEENCDLSYELRKEYIKAVYCHPAYLTVHDAVYIMRNARLDEAQAGIKIAGKNNDNLRHEDDTTLMAESEEELKSHLMKVKEESENIDLKLNIQKTKIMTSDPITSWQIDGEIMGTVRDFIFGGSNTANGDCSHEIKRHLLLGRKVMTNLGSILKSRDITLPKKVCLVKAIVFPVVMYRCESWSIKKAECQRTDNFDLWC